MSAAACKIIICFRPALNAATHPKHIGYIEAARKAAELVVINKQPIDEVALAKVADSLSNAAELKKAVDALVLSLA